MVRTSVPIPANQPADTQRHGAQHGHNTNTHNTHTNTHGNAAQKKDGVVRSSLELVFSYSRSQQRFNGGLPSAPSFVDYQWSQDDSDHDPGTPGEYDTESAWSGDEHDQDSMTSDTVFFPHDPVRNSQERSIGPAGGALALSTVTERDEEISPKSTPLATPLFPAKRGGIMSLFSTTPPVLSSSVGSNGSQTPRPPVRLLPDVEAVAGSPQTTTAAVSNRYHAQRGSLGLHPFPGPRDNAKDTTPPAADNAPLPTESTPLLKPSPRRLSRSTPKRWGAADRLSPTISSRRSSFAGGRRASIVSRRRNSRQLEHVGESSDGQTLFNACAVLVGIGLLSMPLAFSFAGWIGGTVMLLAFSYLTCHTAKLLARMMFADPTLAGYTDIGRKAFGPWAGAVVNGLFCLELFGLSVALVVLFGDSMEIVFPELSSDTYKALGFFLIIPTVFMPLRLLSIPSVLSTIATVVLVGIVVFDGFWKTHAPGSILDPAPTRLGPETFQMNWLGSIGLVLAGFGGHAVIPSVARDMKRPESCDRIFNIAFCIAAAISFISGAAGYLMIGDVVSDEITREMLSPFYGYPRALNMVAVWMIVVTPLTKFGLCSRPLNVAVEGFLNLAPAPAVVAAREAEHAAAEHAVHDEYVPHGAHGAHGGYGAHLGEPRSPLLRPRGNSRGGGALDSAISVFSTAGVSDYLDDESTIGELERPKSPLALAAEMELALALDGPAEGRKGAGRIACRVAITVACVATAVLLPGFGQVLAFLGSFSAFLICIILPLGFWLRLGPRLRASPETPADRAWRFFHYAVLFVSTILMGMGTVWSFIPTERPPLP